MNALLLAVSACVMLGLVSGNSEPQKEIMLFNGVDADKNGHLTLKELESIFFQFDVNTDKKITKAEFENDWVKKFALGPMTEADALFATADANDDNKITSDDLPFIFGYFDMNSDGLVDENEFLTQWGDLTLLPVNPVDSSTPGTTDATHTDQGAAHTTTQGHGHGH